MMEKAGIVRRVMGVAAVVALGMLMACDTKPDEAPSQAMYNQFDRDWQYWMAQYPEAAASFGVPGGEGRWTDLSNEAIATRATYVRESLERIKFVDRATLSAADQLNYDLYRDLLETAVEGLDLQNDAFPPPYMWISAAAWALAAAVIGFLYFISREREFAVRLV